MSARFDNGVYRDCKWCGGRGCLACPGEADKEYNRQFPEGPKPILTVTYDQIEAAEISELTGGPGVEDAFGPLGVLIREITQQIRP